MKLRSLAPVVGLLLGTGCVLAGVYLLFGVAVTLMVGGVALSGLSLVANA